MNASNWIYKASMVTLLALSAFATAPAIAAEALTATEMKAKMTAFVEAINSGMPENVAALFADDGYVEDPIGSPFMKGKEGAKKFAARFMVTGGKYVSWSPMTASPANEAAMVIKARIPNAKADIVVIETFTFKPDGKIASFRAIFGPSDRAPIP